MLLARLRNVNTAVADVVIELLDQLEGGELPSASLRILGERLGELGSDLIAHADRRDSTVLGYDGPPAIAMCESAGGRRPDLRRW